MSEDNLFPPPKAYPWQDNALAHVKTQLSEARQPHATLFRLREGFDDAQLGWQMAKLMLCDSHTACDTCKHCRLLREGVHPNVLYMDMVEGKVNYYELRQKTVGTESIRELEQQLWQTSVFDKPKIAFINGMDLLGFRRQNLLLKTLEEPPKNVFFILTVTNLSRVLPTIMSRVQRLRHGKFDHERLFHWLQLQQRNAMTEPEVAKIAKLADYTPIRALALLKDADLVHKLAVEKSQFADFISGKCSAQRLSESFEKSQEATQLSRYSRYTENMIRFLFDKSQLGNEQESEKRTNKPSENSVQYATWNGVSLRALYRLHDTLTELQRLVDTNANTQLQLTTSLMDWQNERR